MAIQDDVENVMHKIRVKLYPNYLPGSAGKYLARTDNEATLSIEQVCASLKKRGGFKGNYKEVIDHVRHFFDEVAYQLADGYCVNMKYFSVYPNINGTFNSEKDAHDNKQNPVDFRFRILLPLRDLARDIKVEITGLADGNAYIDEFIDRDEESVNGIYVPGDMFCIYGNKIKIAGDNPDCGVYFVPVDDPSKAVKVKRIGENEASMITGIAPDTQYLLNRIEIRTQYANSKTTFLKKPRSIVSRFVLETA